MPDVSRVDRGPVANFIQITRTRRELGRYHLSMTNGDSAVPEPPPRRRWRPWVRRRLVGLLVTAAVLLAFGFLWPFSHEGHLVLGWGAFMVRTFVFHAGVALMAIAAAGVLMRSRTVAIGAVPLILLCVWPEWAPRAAPDVTGPTLRVMSINVLAGNRQFDRAAAQIKDANPDLVLIQEYGPNWHTALRGALSDEYPHASIRPRTDAFGVAVYSKVPLIDVAWFELGRVGTPQVRTTIEHGGHEIAVYTIHLLPPAGLANTRDTWRQHADLVTRLEAETLPVMVVGDFNFTPRSAQAADLRRLGLVESHAQGGAGRGATWPARGRASLAPGIRLDQAYVGPDLGCVESRVLARNGSDHRAILVEVGIRASN